MFRQPKTTAHLPEQSSFKNIINTGTGQRYQSILTLEYNLLRRMFHISGLNVQAAKSQYLAVLFTDINLTHGRGTRAETSNDMMVEQTRTKFGEKYTCI